jgi:hypothetical protein
LNELDATIASELDKRDYLEQLENQMMTSYTAIEERKETLGKLTGAKDYSPEDAKDWRDRMRSAKQAGMWKYVPKSHPGAPGKDSADSQQIKPDVPSSSFSTTSSFTVDCSQDVNEQGA